MYSEKQNLNEEFTIVSNEDYEFDYEEHVKFVRKKLMLILQPYVDSDVLPELLTDDKINVWINSFTPQVLNYDNNYENLEFIGDKVLHWAFPQYLFDKFPEYNPAYITELNNFYMSKIEQGNISLDLKLKELIPNHLNFNFNTDSDIFESFIGALSYTGDLFNKSSGPVLVYNFLAIYFADKVIDTNRRFGAPKTQVQQFFKRFGLKEPIESIREENGEFTIEIYLTIDQIKMLQEALPRNTLGKPTHDISIYHKHHEDLRDEILDNAEKSINMTEELLKYIKELVDRSLLRSINLLSTGLLIGSATGNIQHTTINLAYTNALKTLNNIGVNQDSMKNYRRKQDFMAPNIKPLIPQIEKRNKEKGYEEVFFFVPRKLKNDKNTYLQLIGRDKVDKHHIIITLISELKKTNYQKERLYAIEKYLGIN
jgi:dsRNA-specific ribonuclease